MSTPPQSLEGTGSGGRATEKVYIKIRRSTCTHSYRVLSGSTLHMYVLNHQVYMNIARVLLPKKGDTFTATKPTPIEYTLLTKYTHDTP